MKLLTIGEILAEIIATTKGDGFLESQPLIGPFPSGAPAIFIDQAGKLGLSCTILSRVGNDDFGTLNIRRLKQDGVDVKGIEVADGESTGSAFVRYRNDGGRNFVFNIIHSACGRLKLNTAVKTVIEECDALHIMGSALATPDLQELVLWAAENIKRRGGRISFDPNLRSELINQPGLIETLLQILEKTDIFLPSGDELFAFTQAREESGAIDELLTKGISEIILKRGNQGASFFSKKERIDIAPIKVKEVDPTGAGDCFGGTYVALRLKGESPATALAYANAAGARAVTVAGPMEGTSTYSELGALLNTVL